MLTYARKNGKPYLSMYLEHEEILLSMKEKYEPLLKRIGVYDEMNGWELMIFYLWMHTHEHDKLPS